MQWRNNNLAAWMASLILGVACAAAAHAHSQAPVGGQPAPATKPQSAAPPQPREIHACFDRRDYAKAVELITLYLQHRPSDASMIYNLACAHCMRGDIDGAAAALLRAFQAGFRDLEHMRHDPDLAAMREHATFKKILQEADRVAQERAKSAVDHWRETYGIADYRYETDEKRRVNYATALDEISHKEMREMLEVQADHMIRSLFGRPPAHYVLIAVPTPKDANAFFKGDHSIGGMYEHRPRRLVARDIGSSLRHEFFHAYHFGHMERLGQQHPLWLQEGLATLYEDYELSDEGAIRFLANERQSIVKARGRVGSLTPWIELFALSAEDFMKQSQRLYPQVRSIFEYVAERGKLEEWYGAYIASFKDDRSGAKAFETVFAMPLPDIEKAWRVWLVKQPEVNLRIRVGDASLGIRTGENLSNDGVLITDVLRGSAAAHAQLKRGDVIVAIDGRPTRTLVDLRRVLSERKVGQEVELRARRPPNGEYFTVTLQLRPLSVGL